jgi:CRP-like cAMP-binding protein
LISAAIGLSTLFGLVRLLLDRSKIMLSDSLMDMYHSMGAIEPGHFRQLMRLGRRHFLEEGVILTREGIKPDNLYFVNSGTLIVEKNKSHFTISAPIFIGEIAYMTGFAASATIRTGQGVELVEWNSDILLRATRRKPNLSVALDALIAKDLAKKVAAAVGQDAVRTTKNVL